MKRSLEMDSTFHPEDFQTESSPARKYIAVLNRNFHPKFKVRHGFIEWSISNFLAFPRKKDKFVTSPTFILNETSWYLTLHPTAEIWGRKNIALNLFRHKRDHGSETATVSFRLGLQSGGNKVWFNDIENYKFGKGDCFGMQTSLLGHLEDFLTEDDQNDLTLSVLCEMYVSYYMSEPFGKVKCPTDLRFLSEDLYFLFHYKKVTDTLVESPQCRIRAHKAVLCARSRTLARMLADGSSFIRFSCMTASCLNCLFLYIYTGDLDILAKHAVFSIGLYEYAYKLSLSGLANLLIPTKIHLKSRIIVQELEAIWSISNFSAKSVSHKRTRSPAFTFGSDEEYFSICLHLCPFNLNFMGFRIEFTGITNGLDATFRMCILDNHSLPILSVNLKILQDSVGTYAYFPFVMEEILSCTFESTLVISSVCKRYSLQDLPDTSGMSSISLNDENIGFDDLSTSLQNLYQTGALSDITLKTSGKEFYLHRSILSARSRFFYKRFRFEQQYKHEILEISSETEAYILEMMFEYIYSGKLSDSIDISDVMKLYEAADRFVIGSLNDKCARLFLSKFDNTSVFDVLTFAECRGDPFLIEQCTKYINRLFQEGV